MKPLCHFYNTREHWAWELHVRGCWRCQNSVRWMKIKNSAWRLMNWLKRKLSKRKLTTSEQSEQRG